jgi:putative phosphoesterase
MRILLISDIHANPWALRAVAADARKSGPVGHILCAGDAVNYGPDPAGAVAWLQQHEAVCVRGNHDHAVAYRADPRAAPAKQPLAMAMRDWTRDQLDPAAMAWLTALPRRLECRADGARFTLVHGTPADPLYDYRLKPDASEMLLDELTRDIKTDVLLVGHTHLPLSLEHGGIRVINPGSVGQPLDGDPRAAYAIWEDGAVRLCRVAYDQTEALAALNRLPLLNAQKQELANTLRRGRIGGA